MVRRGTWLLACLWCLAAAAVRAHPILQNPVWIEAAPDKVTLKLEVSVRELIVVQKLETADDGSVDLEQAVEYAGRHQGYLLDHFQVKADGGLLTGTVRDIAPPGKIESGPEGPDRSHFRYFIDYPLTTPPAVLTFSQTMCREFPSAPGVPWDLSYAYRYGPPGQTPLKFGALVRDSELSFNTGFVTSGQSAAAASAGMAAPAASSPSMVTTARPLVWAGLWLLFAAAMALNRGLTILWIQAAAVLWLGAYLSAGHLMAHLPMWLAPIVAGAATILAAIDNIYTWAGDTQLLRRRALLLAGAFCFGLGLSTQEPDQISSARLWMALLVILPLFTAAAVAGLRATARKNGESSLRGLVQIASLTICVIAVWLMLRLLEVIK